MDNEIQLFGYELTAHPITDNRVMEFKTKTGAVLLSIPMEMFSVTTYFRMMFNTDRFSAPAHKVFTEMINGMGGKIHKVVIDELTDGMFFATVYFNDIDGKLFTERTEADDALAIAFCSSCYVYVKESILEAAENDVVNRVRWYDPENERILEKVRAFSRKKLDSLPRRELEELLEIAANTEDFEFARRIKKSIENQKDKS